MPKKVKIYCKDEAEMTHLKEKYPEVKDKATWVQIPEDKIEEFGSPIVCEGNEPLENCLVGERHIQRLAHKEETEE